MTNRQYLMEMVRINAHTINERMPRALCGVNCPPAACTTVCRQYKGLVPRSPKTTPSALKEAQPPGWVLGPDSSTGRGWGIFRRYRILRRCRGIGIVGLERHRREHAVRLLKDFTGVVPMNGHRRIADGCAQ